jgi:signal transduction histidine kinase
MKTYHLLSQISFLKKYSYKFLFVAFLGIHIPLLGLILYALFASEISTTVFILITLGLTLGATALTLNILNSLLKPIILGKTALKEYVEHEVVPNLPCNYSDEVGEMLKNIQHTISRLDEINREKQVVTELISHDLRTPVSQTLQVISLLKENEGNLQDEGINLTLLQEIASKQLTFLDDMLRILKAKHVEIGIQNFEQILIIEIIDSILEDKSFESHQLKITSRIPEKMSVYGHKQGLKQVFENLINNAIKFSQKNGEVIISGGTQLDIINITVKDFGIGFNEQIKSTLFQKFVPGHLGTNGEPSTGLGLYLAKKIIEKHGGTIGSFSAGENQGASFTVSIPIKE